MIFAGGEQSDTHAAQRPIPQPCPARLHLDRLATAGSFPRPAHPPQPVSPALRAIGNLVGWAFVGVCAVAAVLGLDFLLSL